MRDINGNEVTLEMAEYMVKQARRRSDGVPQGYAALPGSGPDGETCGSCKHLFRNEQAKTYMKCSLMRAFWTGGRKSDILARYAACCRWEAP